MSAAAREAVRTPAARPLPPSPPEADPIQTEVIRQSLNASALQMRQAFVRTSFSPIIYEVYDFACAIYDAEYRLLSQALGLQHFMGRLSFCVALAVEAVGGVEKLAPGDILLYNVPYGTGAHAQDAAIVMPVFYGGKIVGYTAIKAHWLDIGGKDPYSTDTVDVFQEGTIFPGVKLCRAGEMVDDIMRMVSANSRVPQLVTGDLQAEIVGVRIGAAALTDLIDRYGEDVFWSSVARMFAHGESVVRSYFSEIPDGVYRASGELDDNGVQTDGIPFEVSITVDGSHVTVDFSRSPGMQAGPVNCPLPGTIAAARVAVMMLAGGGEAPNEGHFAAVDVITRPGTMFHPEAPAPCFLYGWPAIQAIEVIFHALADARPKGVPAASGGCVCSLVWWGSASRRVSRGPTARRIRSASVRIPTATAAARSCTSPRPPRAPLRPRSSKLATRCASCSPTSGRILPARAGIAAGSGWTWTFSHSRTACSHPCSSARRTRRGA